MKSDNLSSAAAALSATIKRITEDADIGEDALSVAMRLRGQLSVSAGASTALEDIERGTDTLATALQAFEAKVREAEASGKPTYAELFPTMPRVPSSDEVARLKKRLGDELVQYCRSRA